MYLRHCPQLNSFYFLLPAGWRVYECLYVCVLTFRAAKIKSQVEQKKFKGCNQPFFEEIGKEISYFWVLTSRTENQVSHRKWIIWKGIDLEKFNYCISKIRQNQEFWNSSRSFWFLTLLQCDGDRVQKIERKWEDNQLHCWYIDSGRSWSFGSVEDVSGFFIAVANIHSQFASCKDFSDLFSMTTTSSNSTNLRTLSFVYSERMAYSFPNQSLKKLSGMPTRGQWKNACGSHRQKSRFLFSIEFQFHLAWLRKFFSFNSCNNVQRYKEQMRFPEI